MLAMNALIFISMLIILPSFLKDIFTGYRMLGYFFHYVKNDVLIPSCLHSFRWENNNIILIILYKKSVFFFFLDVLFSRFFFLTLVLLFGYDVYEHKFELFVVWTFWIHRFMSFTIFGNFTAILFIYFYFFPQALPPFPGEIIPIIGTLKANPLPSTPRVCPLVEVPREYGPQLVHMLTCRMKTN